MNNDLDINNKYNEKFYHDSQENEIIEYGNCYSCNEILYVGDLAVDWNGSICCEDWTCVIKMIDAKVIILEDVED